MRSIIKNKKATSLLVNVLIVGVIVLFLFLIAWPRFGPKLIALFKGSGPMNDQQYQETNQIFNQLTSNIQACNTVDDENCLCKGWPNFQQIFYPDTTLILDNPEKSMRLRVSTRDVWDTNFEPVFEYFSLGLVKIGTTIYVYTPGSSNWITNSFNTINITFNKVPRIEVKDGQKGDYGIIGSEYFFKDVKKQSGVAVLQIITRAGREDLKSLNNKIAELPLCSDKRTQAISSFRKVISAITSASSGQEYTITDLPDSYTIFLRKIDKTAILLYNKQAVKEISSTNENVPAQNLWGSLGLSKMNIIKLESKEVSSSIPPVCATSTKNQVSNGEKLEFKSESGAICISVP